MEVWELILEVWRVFLRRDDDVGGLGSGFGALDVGFGIIWRSLDRFLKVLKDHGGPFGWPWVSFGRFCGAVDCKIMDFGEFL